MISEREYTSLLEREEIRAMEQTWIGRMFERLRWRFRKKAHCVRCQMVSCWQIEETSKYKKQRCTNCGLYFIIVGEEIFDIGVEDF